MVLLFNVFLTVSKANQNVIYDRGNLPNNSKLDITKYSLASLAKAYPWSKAIINIELDSNCYSEEDNKNVYDFITKEFKDIEFVYSSKRCELQKEWQALYNVINSDLIFYLGNHDHIFIDSDNSYLKDLVKIAKKYKNSTIVTSHFPENIRWAKSGYIELNETTPRKLNNGYKINDNYLSYEGICIDSLNIITKSLYYDWFFTGNWGDEVKLPRTDGIGGIDLLKIRNYLGVNLPPQKIIIPYKEQLRHFDGYMHQRITNDTCPSLTVPDGFFENKIKVRYGYNDYKKGWVNINPQNQNYYASDKNGVDDKITLDDLPLFWKEKIIDIDINSNINEEEMIQYKLQSRLQMVYSDERYNPYVDDEIQQKVLDTYLLTHKQYKLA
jgi:hypothetical protein|tara:strand:- start:2853 stop:4001 length:1149 start_codon:yes stop_codon:yes gene_type:complete